MTMPPKLHQLTQASKTWIESHLPPHMHEAVINYIEYGHPIGSFLHAVFSNNLVDAFLMADDINKANMQLYAQLLHGHLPARSYDIIWGEPEVVDHWLAKGQENWEKFRQGEAEGTPG